ncbi:MAG: MarR family transcriptional regulator [Bacteroidales bacterium]
MEKLTELISHISKLVEKVLEESLSEVDFSDLTQQQLHYLQIIVWMKNPTLSELARQLDLTKPTVTVLVDKLVEKGYVIKVKSDKDRRSSHLHIDRKGTMIEEFREVAYERMAEKINAVLSETETAILAELFKKIVQKA